MKLKSEKVENCQIELNIELDDKEIEKYRQRTYKDIANRLDIPGFRKGKTPVSILEGILGKDRLFREVMQDMIPEVYNLAIESEQIKPISNPRIEILETEPVRLKATIPIEPNVVIGDYKSLKIEYKEQQVTDEDVLKVIEQLQFQNATLVPVDNPVEYGDILTMDIFIQEDGKELQVRRDQSYELIKESKLPLPGFSENLLGIGKGDEKNFTLSYEDNYEIKDLAGKKFSFKVNIKEIKKRELPEVNDDFARSIGFSDLNNLREKIIEHIRENNRKRAEIEFENKIFDEIKKNSEIDFSPLLIEYEVERMIEGEARNFNGGINELESYLSSIGRSIQDYKEDLKQVAREKICRDLIIGKIAELENISVTKEEVDTEIDRIVSSMKDPESVRQMFEMPAYRNSVERILIKQKTINHLKDIVKVENEEGSRNDK